MHIVERERPEHADAIRALLIAAFPTPAEQALVDDLRAVAALPVSLVASDGYKLIGHIAFSPVSIFPPPRHAPTWALAPLAVAPEAERRGIGSALVRAGLQTCADDGCGSLVVLGAPNFYHRFGFFSAAERGLRCRFDAPPEAFMLRELVPDSFPHHQGVVHFHAAFDRFLPHRAEPARPNRDH